MSSVCQNCYFIYNQKIQPYQLSCKHYFCSKCLFGQFIINSNSQILNDKRKCFKCQNQSKAIYNSQLHQKLIKANNNIKADKVIQLCLIGSMNIGKSSLMKRLIQNVFLQQTFNTIGFDIGSKLRTIGEYQFLFKIYDTAGTQKFRSVSSMHYKKADILMILYDISASTEDNDLQFWVDEAEQFCQTQNIIIIGNKLDIMKEKGGNQLQNKSILEAKELANKKNWKHITISCKSNQRIAQLWKNIEEMAILKSSAKIKKGNSSIISACGQNEKEKKSDKKGCC